VEEGNIAIDLRGNYAGKPRVGYLVVVRHASILAPTGRCWTRGGGGICLEQYFSYDDGTGTRRRLDVRN
jgi:hypothetical protein